MMQQVLRTVLVAPSRYAEHGVRVFRIGIVQNGALGAIGGLIEDWNARHAATGRVIRYEVFDEKVREPITPALLRRWRDDAAARGERFVLMVCGVQTPLWPRARDIALQAKREGLDVIAGGVHLSGHGPSLDFLVSCGISVGVGEVDTIWDRIIDDCFAATLQPVYKIAPEDGLRVKSGFEDISVPELERLPYPYVPPEAMRHYLNAGELYIDSSRGCPFICSFCVVKNVFGRSIRSREPSELLAWMKRKYDEAGARSFSFIDDNFLRNPRHLEVLEGIAKLRAEGRKKLQVNFILDVESACYAQEDSPRGERTRRFLRLCRDAGVAYVFMGLESTNDAALVEMQKQVNRDRKSKAVDARQALIARYKAAVDAWHDIGAWVECGYILGFEADQPGCGEQGARDTLEIGIDLVHFYNVAPLPGAEDYARAKAKDLLLVTDFNEYFQNAPMLKHPVMSNEQLAHEYAVSVNSFFSWWNVLSRVLRGVVGIGRPRLVAPMSYAKRQIGYKLMFVGGLRSFLEGGLFPRRGKRWLVPREAISDEEARRHYLGTASIPTALPRVFEDDGTMESLPILRRHRLGA